MDDELWLNRRHDDAIIVGRKLGYVSAPAAIGLLAYAGWNYHNFFAILGSGLLVSVASLVSGGLIGFLFGIPKSGAPPRHAQEGDRESNHLAPLPQGSTLRRNTNIEEISDWLTKIIVGLGIFELKAIPRLVQRLAVFLSPAFGGTPGSGAVAVTLAMAFIASGFLLGYLLTVLFVAPAISRTEPVVKAEENLVKDAQSAELVASIAGENQGKVPQSLTDQVLSLARRYERERATRRPGAERTRVMEDVTREMRQLALVALPMVKDLSISTSPGERLAAIAFLQIKPDTSYIDWLADRIYKEVPFVQFQAALALKNAVRSLPDEHRGALKSAVEKAKNALTSSKNPDFETLQQIIEIEKELP
jgi:hypothetical protein